MCLFFQFFYKVSFNSPSELRVQLVFIVSDSAVLDARWGIYLYVCVFYKVVRYMPVYICFGSSFPVLLKTVQTSSKRHGN